MWYWQRDRPIDQWKILENSEMESHKYSQQVFDKGTKTFHQRKNSLCKK